MVGRIGSDVAKLRRDDDYKAQPGKDEEDTAVSRPSPPSQQTIQLFHITLWITLSGHDTNTTSQLCWKQELQSVGKVMETKLTLDQPIIYQIKVSGYLNANWSDWIEEMTVMAERAVGGSSVTTLTGTFDQAALIGLLRRLYYLGLPLISVNCI